MTTLKKTSNESKIARPASVKPRTRKNESPLKPEEKTPGAAKPTTKAKGPARVASQKAAPRKTVSKTPPSEKKLNISVDEVAKPSIASHTKSDSVDDTKGRVAGEQHPGEDHKQYIPVSITIWGGKRRKNCRSIDPRQL